MLPFPAVNDEIFLDEFEADHLFLALKSFSVSQVYSFKGLFYPF